MGEPSSEIMANDDRPGGHWWVALWTVWGMIVGALILWLDRNPFTAAAWAVGGAMVGLHGRRLLNPVSEQLFRWYRRLDKDDEVSPRVRRIARLALNHQLESEEFQRLIREEAEESEPFVALLIPPVFGLLWGTLLGALIGALIPLDSEINLTGLALDLDPGIPASAGALLGVISISILLSCVCSLAMTWIIPIPKRLPRHTRLKWRVRMLISPLLFCTAGGNAAWRTVLQRFGPRPRWD
jgi:hypothetical protein